jgi:glutamate formiminotransferase/formiminotetrahydrofolate cyclodeaminase
VVYNSCSISPERETVKKIIECVPNFSEGGDLAVIKQITDAIESVLAVVAEEVGIGLY